MPLPWNIKLGVSTTTTQTTWVDIVHMLSVGHKRCFMPARCKGRKGGCGAAQANDAVYSTDVRFGESMRCMLDIVEKL